MELVKQSVTIETVDGMGMSNSWGHAFLEQIERAGRVCYKSEDKNPDEDFEKTKKFVKSIIDRGHLSVIEHANLTARFISNRGMTHELVRHRLAAYSQESTRYCNYGNDHVKFIIPPWAGNLKPGMYLSACIDMDNNPVLGLSDNEILWAEQMFWNEKVYKKLLKGGLSPQFARGVLPIDLKTEIVMTANLREWRHIFAMRCSPAAHPQIREIMLELLVLCRRFIPIIFDEIDGVE